MITKCFWGYRKLSQQFCGNPAGGPVTSWGGGQCQLIKNDENDMRDMQSLPF